MNLPANIINGFVIHVWSFSSSIFRCISQTSYDALQSGMFVIGSVYCKALPVDGILFSTELPPGNEKGRLGRVKG